MKSVGEVMALGRNFPEVLQKAVRMLGVGSDGVLDSPIPFKDQAEVEEYLRLATPRRLFAVAEGLYKNYYTVEEIFEFTKIDHWFLTQVKRVTDMAQTLEAASSLDKDLLRQAKIVGFADAEIARLTGKTFKEVYELRRTHKVLPVTKQIDTLAAEFPAQTNYLYTTYLGNENDV